jgi:ribonuclease T
MTDIVFISVDIEADGPIPGDYSMLSLGACLKDNPEINFYIEFKPISDNFVSEALTVSKLDREKLKITGVDPIHALRSLESWLKEIIGDKRPLFEANNAGFDWMFTCWYFWHFLGRNPFGHSSCDIRSYAMGALDMDWASSSLKRLPIGIGLGVELTHNALEDAIAQAMVMQRIGTERSRRIHEVQLNRAQRDVLNMD